MTAPAEVIARAAAAGLRLSCNGDGLRVTGPKAERERLRPLLAEHKAAILAAMAGSPVALPITAALLEDLAERAAIIEESGAAESRQEADRAAVRLVQCRSCRHFTPDGINPLAGIGSCAVNGWPQSQTTAWPTDRRAMPPYPNVMRYCRAFAVS